MGIQTVRRTVPILIGATMLCMIGGRAFAAMGESDIPETSVVPAGPSATASPASRAISKPRPPRAPVAHKRTATAFRFNPADVEPGTARVELREDTWAYAEPAKSSHRVEQVHKGKFVVVTGSTHYYVQVKLKSGKTAYVEQSAVDLVKPADKIFRLTSNAAVLDKPNRWGKKLSEVHKGHDVHVVGIALNYARIRMKSGLEGFIPLSTMQ